TVQVHGGEEVVGGVLRRGERTVRRRPRRLVVRRVSRIEFGALFARHGLVAPVERNPGPGVRLRIDDNAHRLNPALPAVTALGEGAPAPTASTPAGVQDLAGWSIFGRPVVEPRGIEPLTSSLRTRRSPS